MKTSKSSVLLFGAVVAVGAFAGSAQADDLSNGGFETASPTTGTLPDAAGFWRGDMSTIVSADRGVNPYEGANMLRFDNTTRFGASQSSGGEVWQIIDLSSYRSQIRAGNGSVDVSGFFNRTDTPGQSALDTLFSIGVYSYSGEMNTFPSQWAHSELGSNQTALLSDGDMTSWQQIMASLVLPEATDFVVVRISASENMFNDVAGEEFAGHYADGVTFDFNVIPAPSALLCLLPAGLMGIGRRRRQA